jgi:outer membrane protein TolC
LIRRWSRRHPTEPADGDTETLRLTTTRFEGGAAPKSDVAQAQTQLDTTRVADTDIGVMRAQYEHAIAILLGKPHAEFSLPPSPLNLKPPVIPIGVPAQLLERRPDTAAVDRPMAEANEQIGIAKAAYYSSAGPFGAELVAHYGSLPSRAC